MERQHKLQELELSHRKRLIQLETEIVRAKEAAELAHLEFELRAAQIRNDIEAVRDIPKMREEISQRYKQLEEMFAKVAGVIADLPDLVTKLIEKDQRTRFQTAEELVTVFGLRPEELACLGYPSLRQTLVQVVREKAALDRQSVRLWKSDLSFKDIGCKETTGRGARDIGTKRTAALSVSTPLRFEFSSRRPGYVTILNIGTSGRVWLHVPNAYVTGSEASIRAGQACTLPGPDFLPAEDLASQDLDYIEVGPPGWEHIVVLVSNKPLITPEVLCRASPSEPFVELSLDEVEAAWRRLTESQPQDWTGNIMSFEVADRSASTPWRA